jgi:hypothetical protein
MDSRFRVNDGRVDGILSIYVIPAKAGIHFDPA